MEFDDIEMKDKDRYSKEEGGEEEFQEAETDFGGDENLGDEGSPRMKFNRVETLSKLKKDAGNMKRRITTDTKRDF